MANYSQTHYNFTGQFMTGIEGVNTGIIVPWGDSTAPSGFLKCDGTAVSRSTYAALFAVVGTTYGVGDGTTTFNLPDLRDRTVLSRSNTNALASTGGANTVANSGNIGGNLANTTLTTAQLPAHTHMGAIQVGPGGGMGCGGNGFSSLGTTGSTGGGGAHDHSLTATFSGDSTSVLQPYLTLIYIIKT